MTLLLLINAMLLAVIALLRIQSTALIFVCSALATACGIGIFYLMMIGSYRVRLTWLMAAGLLLGYGGGTFNTMLSFGLTGYDPLAAIGHDRHWVAYAMMLVFLACAALLVVGHMEAPLFDEGKTLVLDWKMERFLWLAAIAVAIGFLHGDLGFGGASTEVGTGRLKALGGILSPVLSVIPPLVTIGILQSRGWRRARFSVLMALCFFGLLPLGRGNMFYVLVVCAFAALRLSGWKPPRISGGKKILAMVSFLVLMVVTNFVVMALRMASYEIQRDKSSEMVSGSLSDMVPASIKILNTNSTGVSSELANNLRERTFVIGYLSLLAHGGNTPQPMWGSDAVFSVETVIPDLFYSIFGLNKDPVRNINSEEGLANEHFGLPVYDDANSILTAGIIDFGIAGVILYPIIICFFMRGFFQGVRIVFGEEGRFLAILCLMSLFIGTEIELVTYIGSVRGVIFLLIPWALIHSLPDFLGSSREHHVAGASMNASSRSEVIA